MSKTLKEKFDNINLDAIPEHLCFELETIREETDNFTDEDAIEIFQKNFNYLYFSIGKKYPSALNDYVAPAPPEPTAAELEAKRLEEERLAKEETDRIETERVKQEKIDKALALKNKYKKQTAPSSEES
jgi:hypothetical protein